LQIVFLVPSYYNGWWKADYYYNEKIEHLKCVSLYHDWDNCHILYESSLDKSETVYDKFRVLNYFIKEDYVNAEKHFERLNKISQYSLFFDDFTSNVLIAWSKASQGNKEASFKFIEKVPKSYRHLKNTQNIFLQCYFDDAQTTKSFEKLIHDKDNNFSRYNFFLANYLLFNNKTIEAKKIIKNSRKKYNSNLLIKQTESFFLNHH